MKPTCTFDIIWLRFSAEFDRGLHHTNPLACHQVDVDTLFNFVMRVCSGCLQPLGFWGCDMQNLWRAGLIFLLWVGYRNSHWNLSAQKSGHRYHQVWLTNPYFRKEKLTGCVAICCSTPMYLEALITFYWFGSKMTELFTSLQRVIVSREDLRKRVEAQRQRFPSVVSNCYFRSCMSSPAVPRRRWWGVP